MKNYINLAQPVKCGILQKLILVARADGEVTDTEKEILESICLEVGIPSAFYEKILSYL
jgi:tellurite resistance protein